MKRLPKIYLDVEEAVDDRWGFFDAELYEAIEHTNWHQIPEDVIEDQKWIKETTEAIISRRKERQRHGETG